MTMKTPKSWPSALNSLASEVIDSLAQPVNRVWNTLTGKQATAQSKDCSSLRDSVFPYDQRDGRILRVYSGGIL